MEEHVKCSNLVLGCIADDFTGGSDAASFLAAGGMNTILLNGVPEPGFKLPDDAEAAVITLKSRTQEKTDAIRDSLAAIQWLKEAGAAHFYIKYCSTFDSTPDGNIGPVVDAVLDYLEADGTLLCPALPANGRTVRDGILYVNGIPLAESSMKDHPLTPMRESRISLIMAPQGKYESLELHHDFMQQPDDHIHRQIKDFAKGKDHWYLIPDYETDDDALRITALFGKMKVLTGGSGLLRSLARFLTRHPQTASEYCGTDGPAVIVAGSCSVSTHAQTTFYQNSGGYSFRLTDEGVVNGTLTPESIWQRIQTHKNPLVYSYSTPQELALKRNEAGRHLSSQIEEVLAGTARIAMEHGTTRIISAGGETSGAVTRALGFTAFRIGISIAPGVPVMIPVDRPEIRLVLKSGNFGQKDFFIRALNLTQRSQT